MRLVRYFKDMNGRNWKPQSFNEVINNFISTTCESQQSRKSKNRKIIYCEKKGRSLKVKSFPRSFLGTWQRSSIGSSSTKNSDSTRFYELITMLPIRRKYIHCIVVVLMSKLFFLRVHISRKMT